MSCQQIVTSFLFFQFVTNLEPSGSQILNVFTFSLIITFCFTSTENRIKPLKHGSHNTALSKKVPVFQKNADISKINYVCTYLPIFKFVDNF